VTTIRDQNPNSRFKKTYELLEEICSIERRKKIDQIRLMVEDQSQEGNPTARGGSCIT
jgi:hypothetical protein